MTYILGMGSAYPKNSITTPFLDSLGIREQIDLFADNQTLRGLLQEIDTRRSVLDEQYIGTAKNLDLYQALPHSSITTAELAYEASMQAMNRAGITPEQLGLILADCISPCETTPSEAHRIGKKFNIKVPAFDVSGGYEALFLQLNDICRKKKERSPEYILCISVNAPTQRVDYSQGLEGRIFGDAAVALVLSNHHQGKVAIRSCAVTAGKPGAQQIRIPLLDHLRLNVSANAFAPLAPIEGEISTFVETFWTAAPLAEARRAPAYAKTKVLSNFRTAGDSIGSSMFSPLADAWDTLQQGEVICVPGPSGNSVGGQCILEVRL